MPGYRPNVNFFFRSDHPDRFRSLQHGAVTLLLVAVFFAFPALAVNAQEKAEPPAPSSAPHRTPPSKPVVNTVTSGEFVRPRRATEQKPSATAVGAPLTPSAATITMTTAVASPAGEAEGISELRAQIKEAKSDSDRAFLQRSLVNLLADQGREAEAITELRAMTREERFDPAGLYNTGNALARLGDSGAAVEAYRKAISQRHGHYSRAQNNLGVVLIRLGRWDEAFEALAGALRVESYTYAEASYNLGRLYALRGETGLAIREWSRTLSLQPEHADAAAALARALAEDGNPERGIRVLDAFTARLSGRSTSGSGGAAPRVITITRGEIIAARNVATAKDKRTGTIVSAASPDALKADGDGVRPPVGRAASPAVLKLPLAVDQSTYDLLQRARTAREERREEEAAKLYRQVIERRGGYFPPANLELGYTLASLQRPVEAIASLLPVATADGARYPIAFYHLGRLYEQLGQLKRAFENYSRASVLYGDDNPEVHLDISRVLEKQGDMTGALAAMQTYVGASRRLGAVPEWTTESLTRLEQKAAAAAATPAVNSGGPKQ